MLSVAVVDANGARLILHRFYGDHFFVLVSLEAVKLSGRWRRWPEIHVAFSRQSQGRKLPNHVLSDYNPLIARSRTHLRLHGYTHTVTPEEDSCEHCDNQQ